MLKYTVISGSHRKVSQSAKIAKVVEKLILKENPSDDVGVIELANNPLPLWDEGVFHKDAKWTALWTPYSEALKASDAIVVVSPEWGGMVPPGLKNFFLLCGNLELGHKPGLIITVSAATGGAYPVAELRMGSYKNNHFCYIPDHVIVRNANNILNDLDNPTADDDRIRVRISYSLAVLKEYAMALRAVRNSPVINFKDFANGM